MFNDSHGLMKNANVGLATNKIKGSNP